VSGISLPGGNLGLTADAIRVESGVSVDRPGGGDSGDLLSALEVVIEDGALLAGASGIFSPARRA
jgi:hypothetical protein